MTAEERDQEYVVVWNGIPAPLIPPEPRPPSRDRRLRSARPYYHEPKRRGRPPKPTISEQLRTLGLIRL